MTNAYNMRCPKCRRTDRIDVEAILWIRITDTGFSTEAAEYGGQHWDDDSAAVCAACGQEGIVKRFTVKKGGAK